MIQRLKKILKKNAYLHEMGKNLSLKFRKPLTIIYVTSRCNSRCPTCNYWQKTIKDLSCNQIHNFLSLWNPRYVLFQGGEFYLHPEWEGILSMTERISKVYMLTNGILTERIAYSANNYRVQEFTVSVNGEEDTQIKTRGFNYLDRIVNSLCELKKLNQRISIAFLLTGITKVSDFEYVETLAKDLDCKILINIIGQQANFNINENHNNIFNLAQNPYLEEILHKISSSKYVPDIDKIYTKLFNGYQKINLPCKSIRSDVVVLENGDIVLCQNKENIYMNIEDITDSNFVKDLRKKKNGFIDCNECWLSCHRKLDIILNLSKTHKILSDIHPRLKSS